jgi:cleavage and polyadenylation specificity factor subunit 1
MYCTLQVPLHGTPHQVTYYTEQSLYPLIVSVPVSTMNCNHFQVDNVFFCTGSLFLLLWLSVSNISIKLLMSDSRFHLLQVIRPLNQVLSSMADQELGMHIENEVTSGDDLQKVYTVDEFEVRIMELEKPSGSWATRFTIPMQPFEHTLTVRIVTLQVNHSFPLILILC